MKCAICGKKIEGELDRLSSISVAGGRDAHFSCYYPKGVPLGSLELPKWALEKLKKLDPVRAKYFREG